MSSRVIVEYDLSSVSILSPWANIRTIWWTGMRVPRMQAWPWQIRGWIEMRSFTKSKCQRLPTGASASKVLPNVRQQRPPRH